MYPYGRSTIKSNPLLETYRVALLFMGIGTAFLLILSVLIVFAILVGEQKVAHTVNVVFFELPAFVLALVGSSLQYRYWKRIEQRRLAAAQGDYTLLAEEQPAPNASALALPAVFRMGMSKAQVLLVAALLELAMVVFSVGGGLIFDDILFFWALLGAGIVVVLILTPIFFVTSRETLEATEVELRLCASRPLSGMVRWNEARLFAVYAPLGAQRNGALLTYELSSTSSIVRWTRALHPSTFGMHMDPGMPLAEHNQAMQALCQVVAARTGLPLYDISKAHIPEARGEPH